MDVKGLSVYEDVDFYGEVVSGSFGCRLTKEQREDIAEIGRPFFDTPVGLATLEEFVHRRPLTGEKETVTRDVGWTVFVDERQVALFPRV